MADEAIFMSMETFLRQRVRKAVAFNAFGSVAALVFGIVVCVITFWILYAIIWYAFNGMLPHTHQTRMIICGIVLVILFMETPELIANT
jgi:hypothetical protein